MEKMVRKAIIRYLKKHFPGKEKKIIRKADAILPKLKAKAPDMGGKENPLAGNLDMFLLFLSFYEATGHRMSGEAIDEIIEDLYRQMKWMGGLLNINRKLVVSVLRSYLYKSYTKYSNQVKEKQAKGEWMDTWGMLVNPDNKKAEVLNEILGLFKKAKALSYERKKRFIYVEYENDGTKNAFYYDTKKGVIKNG